LALRFRLARFGRKGRPFYRIVVADSRAPRDGMAIAHVGYYDPIKDPHEVKIDRERVKYFWEKGARPTETVRSLFRKEGILKELTQ
jgi:small subunit ribosomal protein S16